MRRGWVVLLVATMPVGVGVAEAVPILLCARPDASITVTTFVSPDVARITDRLRRDGIIPTDPAACWDADSATLPPKFRADPRDPTNTLTQRHRWRRAGQAVVLDPTVKRPHDAAIQREYGRAFSASRRAEVAATALGSFLDRAVREGRWADVRATLDQTGTGQPLTVAEIAQFKAILRDYEAD